MSDEQTDDTSTPFVSDEYFHTFLAGRVSHPGRADFANLFQQITAEMNRRLVRQQAKVLEAQNVLIKSQDRSRSRSDSRRGCLQALQSFSRWLRRGQSSQNHKSRNPPCRPQLRPKRQPNRAKPHEPPRCRARACGLVSDGMKKFDDSQNHNHRLRDARVRFWTRVVGPRTRIVDRRGVH
jgi:hypothetical protein